jgi:hypothetical protein
VVFGIVQMLARGNPNPSRKITVKRIVEYGYPALNDRSAIDGIRQLVREGLVLVDRYGGGGLEVRPWYNPEWAPTRENPDRTLHGDPSPRREISSARRAGPVARRHRPGPRRTSVRDSRRPGSGAGIWWRTARATAVTAPT